jgi:anionic cell wall polymer biosynthesis LytR-Cps2A-Psr (LCP) family protein
MGLMQWFGKPYGAAFASFLFPGLGQAAAGDRRRGAIVAIPAVAIAVLLVGLVLFARHAILDNATNEQWLTSLFMLNVVALVYHLWAMADAYMVARQGLGKQQRKSRIRGPRFKWTTAMAVVILASGPLAVHGAVAIEDLSLRGAAACLNSPIPCWMLNNTTEPGASGISQGGDSNVDVPGVTDTSSPDPSSSGSPASATPDASLQAPELPQMETTQNSADWAKDKVLNLLLVGVDQGPGRSDFLTDTMILVQVDTVTGKSAMYGVARNLYCIPLPKGGIAENFPNPDSACDPGTFDMDMVNGLWYDAAKAHPQWYPFYPRSDCNGMSGSDYSDCVAVQDYKRGIFALEQAIGTLTGVHVDGTALINLPGFARLIDDLGGVDVDVPSTVTDYPCGPAGTWAAAWRICDIRSDIPLSNGGCAKHCHMGYSVSDGTGAVVAQMKRDAANSGGKQSITWQQSADIAFVIKPGLQHMSGEWALAYARSRIYYTDENRMARQQLVLKSVRNGASPCTLLPRLLDPNGLLHDLGQFFWTNMPTDGSTLTTLAGLAQHVTGDSVQHFSLDSGTLGSPSHTTRITKAGWAVAQNMVRHGLDKAPPASGGSGGSGGGGFSC